MGNWLRELWAFFKSVLAEWITLLTGGVPAAVISVWGYVKAQPTTTKVGYSFLILTLLTAFFFSWRKQWRVADANFIKESPQDLIGIWLGKTSPHATSIVKPYLNQKIKATCAFVDISPSIPGFRIVSLNCDQVHIAANIPFWRANSFSCLPKGAVITVTGNLTKIYSSYLEIGGIEIVAGLLQSDSQV